MTTASKNMPRAGLAGHRLADGRAGPREFMKRFSERLSALAASQDLLVSSGWQRRIGALVQLAAFALQELDRRPYQA